MNKWLFAFVGVWMAAGPPAWGQSFPVGPTPSVTPVESIEDKDKKPEVDSFWGAAVGAGWIQDYPGAGQGRTRFLVMPTYKSKHITIDRQEGVKGEILSQNSVKFSVSFSFLFPTKSRDIPVRTGMPDLGWTFQLGPEIQIYLYRSLFHTMYLRLPLRFVGTTDFQTHSKFRDWNFAPSLRNSFYLGKGWGELTTRLEVDYASEAFNDLFYEVAPEYATATRPAYDARSGIMEYIVGLNYAYQDLFPWTFFVGGNIYFMSDSANRESPLLVKTRNYSVLGGIIRYF